MSDTEEPDEPEPKKSIFDKITKKHVNDFLESLLIITVSLVFIFFYPLIRYYSVEGLTLARCYYDPPVGHGEPLGGHVAPDVAGVRRPERWPTPIKFFDDYISESRPIIMRGLAREFPAFQLWTDEYLREEAGAENVTVLNRDGYYNLSSLDRFLLNYTLEQNHLFTEIPSNLAGDLVMPSPIICGNFVSSLAEVVLWMNGGNVTAGLSTENVDGLHCSIQGKMSLVLISRLQHEHAKEAVTQSLEQRKIDLCWYRSVQKLNWLNVTLEEGDCIYIPSKWYKEIAFNSTRNLGVNFRFFRLLYFNQSDCDGAPSNKLRNARSEDVLLKFEIISLSENHASLDWYTFWNLYYMPGINEDKSLGKLFKLLDHDRDGEVLPEDMYRLKTTEFLDYFKGFKSKDTTRQRNITANVSLSNVTVENEL